MRKYRGPLLEVTPVYAETHALGGWRIERIRIGDRTLRNLNVDDIAARELLADPAREVCLYVVNLPIGAVPFPFTPNLLGMKYVDTGEKHLIPFSFARNSCVRFAVIPALIWSLGGGVAGAVASSVLSGVGIITSPTVAAGIPGLAFVGGLILAWGSALQIALAYVRARID
jgi:hypothetical protein